MVAESSKPARMASRLLLQIDLEGHSAWMKKQPSMPDAVSARIKFADLVDERLRQCGFMRHSWAGDGGIYAADALHRTTFDFAIGAADAAAKAFHEWCSEEHSRSDLGLRVSIHHASQIYIHDIPGYWTSEDLNFFAKFEREIGLSGAIAITDSFHRNLSPEAQNRFTYKRMLRSQVADHLIKLIYYNAVDSGPPVEQGFFTWLKDLPWSISPEEVELGPISARKPRIGGAALLASARHPRHPLRVELVKGHGSSANQIGKLTSEEKKIYEEILEDFKKQSMREGREDGRKVCVDRMTLPLSEVAFVEMTWHEETWSSARGFHKLLEQNPQVHAKFAANALLVAEEGLGFPGILCCHCVVRTRVQHGIPPLLLCQRQRKGQHGTYLEGFWSLSFEEQLMPDETIDQCIKRGLIEEFLGRDENAVIPIRIMAVILERPLLNVAVIAVVDIPYSYDEIIKMWRSAIDKDEHRQICSLQLDRGNLLELATGEITQTLRSRVETADRDLFSKTTDWQLHHTSLARAAFGVWANEYP